VHALSPSDDGPTRIMVTERHLRRSREPGLSELRDALTAVYGTDYGVHSPTSLFRFTDMARQAARYRSGRVLLAGDAAHVHHPVGGQGLNTGLQDAVNLGWKLAQVVHGTSCDDLLDTYHDERHPVGARVLRNAVAQMALLRQDDRSTVLHGAVAELLALDEPRRHVAAMMSGLDIRYDLGDGHPLLGRRMPDLELSTAGGTVVRVYELLHGARPVLLDLGVPGGVDLTGWQDRVQRVTARCERTWELPVLGQVPAPCAVLIRPDGHVAWVAAVDGAMNSAVDGAMNSAVDGARDSAVDGASDSAGDGAGLAEALLRWFGAPATR
jgi:hypothetical protein